MSAGQSLSTPDLALQLGELQTEQTQLMDKISRRIFDLERFPLLSQTVWGRIEWPRPLGRPAAPTLWQGFSFTHIGRQEFLDQDSGRTVELTAPKPQPFAWDDLSDSQLYRVNFWAFASQVGGKLNQISVDFAPGVPWSRPDPGTFLHGLRMIAPRSQNYDLTEGGPVVLKPFKVRVRPFVFLNR
jgi:hypothetical protein